ncbi:MAG: hypothetical protein KDA42_14930, partial [Planctomycetales bacterium]|nr:hypothetical protein [Planctomycetales bacterium]
MTTTARLANTLIFVSLFTLATQNNQARAALVAHWTFDEGAGTTANDTSGSANVHNGTLSSQGTGSNPVWLNSSSAAIGGALQFTAATTTDGSLVNIPHHADLNLTNSAFTLSYWYRNDGDAAPGGFPGMFRKGSGSADGWIIFRSNSSDALTFKSRNIQPPGFGGVGSDTWHLLTIAYDGGTNTEYYNDGVNVNTAATNWGATLANTAILEIGRADSFDTFSMDDAAIWNQQVTAAEATALYNMGSVLGLNAADFDGARQAHSTSGTVVASGSKWGFISGLTGFSDGDVVAGDGYYLVVFDGTAG